MSTTANMDLVLPVVSTTIGPEYATLINEALERIDSHTHTPDQGVAIPVSGLNIATDLPLGGNSLTQTKSVVLNNQTSEVTTLTTLYPLNGDIYFVDGSGNQVRLTQSGAVAGTPGSISNLTSPASAAYVSASSKFTWQSGTNLAADMDFRSAIMRNAGASSFGLTLNPPSAMAADISQTLPTIPASTKIMQMDSSGVMSTVLGVDNSSLQITSSASLQTMSVKSGGVTNTMIAAVGQIFSASSGAYNTTGTSYSNVTNLSNPITTIGKPVYVGIMSDGNVTNPSEIVATAGNYCIVGIFEDGTEISTTRIGGGADTSSSPNIWFLATPAAGAHTYLVKIKSASGGAVAMNYSKLICYELK